MNSIDDNAELSKWMEITPAGRRTSSVTHDERWRDLHMHLWQVAFMVRWNLMEKSFGRALGRAWIILDPMMQAALYLFLLILIFRVNDSDISFTFLLVTLTFWRLHANLLSAAPTLFTSKGPVLQQSSFPARLIVYEFILTEVAFFCINLVVALGVILAFGVRPNLLWLLVPVIFLIQLVFSSALVIFVGLLGAVVRDVGPVLVFFVTVWFYLSPVIYGVSRVPASLERFMYLNPFAIIMPAYQAIFFGGVMPSAWALGAVFVSSLILLVLGLRLLSHAQHRIYRFL